MHVRFRSCRRSAYQKAEDLSTDTLALRTKYRRSSLRYWYAMPLRTYIGTHEHLDFGHGYSYSECVEQSSAPTSTFKGKFSS